MSDIMEYNLSWLNTNFTTTPYIFPEVPYIVDLDHKVDFNVSFKVREKTVKVFRRGTSFVEIIF
jgi:hypothetical protein